MHDSAAEGLIEEMSGNQQVEAEDRNDELHCVKGDLADFITLGIYPQPKRQESGHAQQGSSAA